MFPGGVAAVVGCGGGGRGEATGGIEGFDMEVLGSPGLEVLVNILGRFPFGEFVVPDVYNLVKFELGEFVVPVSEKAIGGTPGEGGIGFSKCISR